jgi:hypothetical protein
MDDPKTCPLCGHRRYGTEPEGSPACMICIMSLGEKELQQRFRNLIAVGKSVAKSYSRKSKKKVRKKIRAITKNDNQTGR